MKKPTTELTTRRLLDHERRYLYEYLATDIKNKYNNYKENFFIYLTKLVKDRIVTSEIEYITNKKYCASTRYVSLNLNRLELPQYFGTTYKTPVPSSFSLVKIDDKVVSLLDKIKTSPRYKFSTYQSSNKIDITEDLLKNCSQEEIDQLKEHLMELSKLEYETKTFGISEGILSPSIYGSKKFFYKFDTWGQIFSKSPEYFEILSEHYLDKEELETNTELNLLKDLKTILGY